MRFGKNLSLALICSQAILPLAFASPAPTVTATAATADTSEVTLLESLVALSGQNLPGAELQRQMTNVLERYDATAPLEGRNDRIAQALVTLQMSTPQQARAFETQVGTATQQLVSARFASQQEAQKAFQGQLAGLVSTLQGAQFSESGMCYEAIAASVLGTAALVVGIVGSGSDNSWVQAASIIAGTVGFAGAFFGTIGAFSICGSDY